MVKNYISENLEHLVKSAKVSQDDFGNLFDLNRGVVGQYIRGQSGPKIETIQRICAHYKISIDDFVNRKLAEVSKPATVAEPAQPYGQKYIELLEKSIQDKDEIIANLRERLGKYESDNRKNTA